MIVTLLPPTYQGLLYIGLGLEVIDITLATEQMLWVYLVLLVGMGPLLSLLCEFL